MLAYLKLPLFFASMFLLSGAMAQVIPPDEIDNYKAPQVRTAQEPTEIPTTTMNVGVESIDSRIYRIFHELTKNESARITGIGNMDKGRMDSYYAELLRTIELVGVAGSDTCATDIHGWYHIGLSDIITPVVKVENEAINSAVRYLLVADLELRKSQSTRRNDCLESTDYQDLVSIINKSKEWLDSFFANDTPLDMPQSHPRRPVVEPSSAPGSAVQ